MAETGNQRDLTKGRKNQIPAGTGHERMYADNSCREHHSEADHRRNVSLRDRLFTGIFWTNTT